MKIVFYDTKPYDRESFERCNSNYPDIEVEYEDADLTEKTAMLARGADAVCAFVNSNLSAGVIDRLADEKVRCILLRCAGFNNVDIEAAKKHGITVLRVPGYSPEAVAELAMTLALGVNRHLHKSYIRVRENNFSLNGLTGSKIGAAMCRICHGFGMNVIAYDMYPNKNLDFVTYKSLDEVLSESDLISLHCPLTEDTYHLICMDTIRKMKDNVILVNTSRGALVATNDLIEGIREKKFFGVGLDVYEEEGSNVFENREDEVLQHSTTARLLSFPNVIVTSHQGFLTEEALEAISLTTFENAVAFERGNVDKNNVVC